MSVNISPIGGAAAQFFDNNGNPLSGGKLYTYAAGTTTPLAVYTTSAGNVAHTNPIILDSAGRVPGGQIWLTDGGVDYKFLLETSTNVLVGTFDNIPPAVSGNASDIVYLPAGTGAAERTVQNKLRDSVSVKDFGVTGDGLNGVANRIAWQNAITYCQDNLKTLYIPGNDPSQSYTVAALSGVGLLITKPIKIVTDGSHSVTIVVTGLVEGQFALTVDGTNVGAPPGTYERAEIGGFTLLASAGDCMQIKNVSNSKFYDIGLRNSRGGIVYTGTRCYSNSFEKVITYTAISATAFRFLEHTGGGHHSFRECSFGGSTGFSIDFATLTDNVSFYQCNFEQCVVNSFFCGGTVAGLAFYGCRTEGCGAIDFLINPAVGKIVSGFVVSGTSFSASNNGGAPRVQFGGDGGKVRGFDISGNSVGHGASNFSSFLVNFNGEGASGVVSGNYLDGLVTLCSPSNGTRPGISVFNNEANNGAFESLITSISNANGVALRFTDGTQICTHTLPITTVTAKTWAEVTWTFPAAFSAAPRVYSSLDSLPSNQQMMTLARAPGTTNCTVGLNSETPLPGSASVQAIGRWF